MNVLILNTYDSEGGAAIATYRMHVGLGLIGVYSQMLVLSKKTDDRNVMAPVGKWRKTIAVLRPPLEQLVHNLYRKRQKVLFSSAWVPDRLASKVTTLHPDIVHLFWINGGFFRIETLKKIKQPIVWTLHDMWPFTGGCHYDDECGKFRQSCGSCPVLESDRERDLSRRVWLRKRTSWDRIPMTIVATSRWLGKMARASSLFKDLRIEVIPNGIDTDKYKPADKKAARDIFNFPQDKRLILFSAFNAASDQRKGAQLLLPALKKMSRSGWDAKAEVVVIGSSRPENPPDFGMKVHYIAHLNDEISQVLLYSAADVVVAPSIQENLSNTVMESLACGTPVAAFDIGGMPDMIDHRESGYLARPFESDDLAEGIGWILENEERRAGLSRNARHTALSRYALRTVANRYLELYQSMFK